MRDPALSRSRWGFFVEKKDSIERRREREREREEHIFADDASECVSRKPAYPTDYNYLAVVYSSLKSLNTKFPSPQFLRRMDNSSQPEPGE